MTLEHVHIIWSHGLGLLALNSLGYCSITNCTISNNGRTKGTQIGGNAHFVYQLTEMEHNLPENVLKVSHSDISYGLNNSTTDINQLNTSAGGMMIVIYSLPIQYQFDILILSCTFHHNEANANAIDSIFVNGKAMRYGLSLLFTGNIFSTNHCSRMKLLISNSTFLGNKGGGLYTDRMIGRIYSLEMLNSSFINNGGNGARILLHSFNQSNFTIVIRNSTFTNNYAPRGGGGGLDISLLSGDFGRITLDMKHCHFEDNSGKYNAGGFRLAVAICKECTQHSMSVSMHDTHFASNVGGHVALDLLKGSEVLITSCTFRQGYGYYGGAIEIIGIPVMDSSVGQWKNIFVRIMRTKFMDNSAWNGGAISIKVTNEVTTSIYVTNCVFLTNCAERNGGAILLRLGIGIDQTMLFNRFKTYQNFIIENTTLSNNSAMQGAGFYID